METTIKEPLYKRLNKERQQGTFEAVQFNLPHKDICIKMSELKTESGQWKFADRVCEHFHNLETAQYTAIAVNNFHLLAEALEKLHNVVMQSNDRSIFDNGKNAEIVAKAKEVLNKIS